jgi:hypothetical protein
MQATFERAYHLGLVSPPARTPFYVATNRRGSR